MTGFSQKKIYCQETIGEKLRQARLEKKLNFEEIEERIDIKSSFLKALEDNDYHQLPGKVYIENFLKIYADFLGLDAEDILKIYQRESKILNSFSSNGEYKKEPKFCCLKILKPRFFIALILLIVVFYLGWMIKKSITPPQLMVYSPVNNLITKNREIEVSGEVEKAAQLAVNGQEVFYNDEGEFKEKIALQDGLNIIEITAIKKHSKEEVILRKVMVVEDKGLEIIEEK